MYQDKRILAIIPARGGSKGIPNKNIMPICGKPLIAYTIEEAIKSRYIDKTIVSTDSEKIKEVAQTFKAEVPFLRPNAISNDSAKSIDVVLHALDFLKEKEASFDYVILLQPTSPLRTVKDIDTAIEQMMQKQSTSLVSVCEVEENPVLMRTIYNGNLQEVLQFDGENLRRQDLPTFYIFNGAIYINEVKELYEKRVFVHEKTMPYIMEKQKSADIDTMLDAKIVEWILEQNNDFIK